MARVMEKVVPVKIMTDKINCYATIERAMITATTASLRLGDKKMAELFTRTKDFVVKEYNALAEEYLNKPGNKAEA